MWKQKLLRYHEGQQQMQASQAGLSINDMDKGI